MVALVFLFGGGEEALPIVGFMVAIFLSLLAVAVLIRVLTERRLRRDPFEVQIGYHALYRGGQAFAWSRLGHRFRGAWVNTENSKPVLSLYYSMAQSVDGDDLAYGFLEFESVVVSIPDGRIDEAKEIARKLNEFHGIRVRES